MKGCLTGQASLWKSEFQHLVGQKNFPECRFLLLGLLGRNEVILHSTVLLSEKREELGGDGNEKVVKTNSPPSTQYGLRTPHHALLETLVIVLK